MKRANTDPLSRLGATVDRSVRRLAVASVDAARAEYEAIEADAIARLRRARTRVTGAARGSFLKKAEAVLSAELGEAFLARARGDVEAAAELGAKLRAALDAVAAATELAERTIARADEAALGAVKMAFAGYELTRVVTGAADARSRARVLASLGVAGASARRVRELREAAVHALDELRAEETQLAERATHARDNADEWDRLVAFALAANDPDLAREAQTRREESAADLGVYARERDETARVARGLEGALAKLAASPQRKRR